MMNLATTVLVAGAIAVLVMVGNAPSVQAEGLTAECRSGNAAGSFKAEASISTYLIGLEHTVADSDEWFEVPGTRLEFQGEEGTVPFTINSSRAPVQARGFRIALIGYKEGEVVIELFSKSFGPCQVVGTPAVATPIPTESSTPTQELVSETSGTAQPPTPPEVVVLPDTGYGPENRSSVPNPLHVLFAVVALTGSLLVPLRFLSRTAHR